MPPEIVTVADAERAAREAQDLVAALEDRVREGDAEVTPAKLAEHRELAAFAQLRVEAAQRTQTRVQEEERAALGAAAKDAAEELITGAGPGEIAEAMRAAVNALAALAALVHERNARISEVGRSLAQLDEDVKRAGLTEDPWGSQRYGVWGARDRLVVPGVGDAHRVDLGDLTVTAVVCGLGVSAEGREAQTRAMHAFHGLRVQGVANLLQKFPWLSDALRASQEEFEAADQTGRAMLTNQGRHPV